MLCHSEAFVISLLALTLLSSVVICTELTFELPDRDTQCFHEDIQKDTKCILEFQVVSGGNYDVDIRILDPDEKTLYDGRRKQYDSVQFTTTVTGDYLFCFSNQFSSFTHKVVYFDFVVGDEPPLTTEMGAQHSALTQLETSCVRIHDALKLITDYQTHHRLREIQGRDTAEYLFERVQYWSLGVAVLLVLVGFAQVFILRRFFTDKRRNI